MDLYIERQLDKNNKKVVPKGKNSNYGPQETFPLNPAHKNYN